jgi:IS605 OrfB family transposase
MHVQVKSDAPEPMPSPDTLGVDLGRRRVAVDSDGTIYESTEVNRLRAHYPKVRRSLQARCTKGARRALKRLSGREQRHMRAVNHVISRRLVDTAHATRRSLALEDLTGIRQRTRVHKPHRYAQQSWAFAQLRAFVTYKAQDAGVPVRLVDPAYTSQTCHRCDVRGKRDGLVFACEHCGSFDADINAAINISRGRPVTRPERAGASVSSAKAAGL